MKTHALKALSKRRAAPADVVDSRAPVQDPLGRICARHRDNPFVRFVRAAFFYDEVEYSPARDRTASDKIFRGPLRGSLKF